MVGVGVTACVIWVVHVGVSVAVGHEGAVGVRVGGVVRFVCCTVVGVAVGTSFAVTDTFVGVGARGGTPALPVTAACAVPGVLLSAEVGVRVGEVAPEAPAAVKVGGGVGESGDPALRVKTPPVLVAVASLGMFVLTAIGPAPEAVAGAVGVLAGPVNDGPNASTTPAIASTTIPAPME